MNKYSKTYNADKTLYPNLFSVLKALPDNYYLGEQHTPHIRHPGGILNRAADEVVDSFIKVFGHLDALSASKDDTEKQKLSKDLLDDMSNLFGHFDSLQDECYLILRSLCPPPTQDNAIGEKTVREWLRRNDYDCGIDFLGRTGNIQQLIDCFTNKLKHANQNLDFVTASVQEFEIPGFFMDNLKGEEISKIYMHLPQEHHKTCIAISFNAILKLLIICFYEICDALEKSIKKHLKSTHNVKFTKREIVKHTDKFLSLIDSIASMGDIFYPYEYRKFPRIIKNGTIYQISYPNKTKIPYSAPLQAKAQMKADGYTKKFHLPFFG